MQEYLRWLAENHPFFAWCYSCGFCVLLLGAAIATNTKHRWYEIGGRK